MSKKPKKPNPRRRALFLLGISESDLRKADYDEDVAAHLKRILKIAFKKCAKFLHPDVDGGDAESFKALMKLKGEIETIKPDIRRKPAPKKRKPPPAYDPYEPPRPAPRSWYRVPDPTYATVHVARPYVVVVKTAAELEQERREKEIRDAQQAEMDRRAWCDLFPNTVCASGFQLADHYANRCRCNEKQKEFVAELNELLKKKFWDR